MSNAEESLATLLRWEKLTPPGGWAREYQFAAPRKWRFDFAAIEPGIALAIEVEGGHWVGGHAGERFEQDAEKYNEAALRGWTVLRVTPRMIEDGRAIALIRRALGVEVAA